MSDQRSTPSPDAAADTDELRKDLASSLTWSFQGLLAAAAFCAVTAASHEDWELLTGATTSGGGGEIDLPVVSVKLAFLFFLLIGPLVLLAMQGYLQIQCHALMSLREPAEPADKYVLNVNGLLRNHDRWWPISLLGIASYAVVPLVTAFLLWKIWPRAFADDTVLLGFGIHFDRLVVLSYFVASCIVSLRGALADRCCLAQMRGHASRRRFNRIVAAGLVLASAALLVAVAIAFADRHLDMRKAPLAGADLRYFDMRDADLREARLNGASMSGAMLQGADLRGANMDGADLRGAYLSHADLTFARLNGADLTGAWLVRADLTRVEIEGANFEYALMLGTRFEPLPRTPLNRDAAPAGLDKDDAAGLIRHVQFENANFCGARVAPGNWSPGISLGAMVTTAGKPFRDRHDLRNIPAEFQAIAYPDEAYGPDGGVTPVFVEKAADDCETALRICDVGGDAALCSSRH